MYAIWRHRRRRHQRNDSGFTLIEMTVVMTIFGVLMAITYSVLTGIQAQSKRDLQKADDVGQVRVALEQIDRQVRSGNVLYSPANEKTSVTGVPNCYASGTDAGNCMRVYTRANGNNHCVEWRLTGGKLESRSWPTDWQTNGGVSGWRTVASNIVNSDTSSTPGFVLQGTTSDYGARLVDITIQVNQGEPMPVTVETSLAGRNTEYGYDPSVCSPVPASS